MKRIEEIVAKIVEDIDAEIAIRQKLVSQMVGQLYPSIVRDEIQTLRNLKAKVTSL